MNNYTFNKGGFTFIRIPKNIARVAYNNGLTVLFCACNLRPGYPWYPECEITKQADFIPAYPNDPENDFDFIVTVFETYNCTDNQTGKYTAFYIPVTYDSWYTDKKPEYDYRFMEKG